MRTHGTTEMEGHTTVEAERSLDYYRCLSISLYESTPPSASVPTATVSASPSLNFGQEEADAPSHGVEALSAASYIPGSIKGSIVAMSLDNQLCVLSLDTVIVLDGMSLVQTVGDASSEEDIPYSSRDWFRGLLHIKDLPEASYGNRYPPPAIQLPPVTVTPLQRGSALDDAQSLPQIVHFQQPQELAVLHILSSYARHERSFQCMAWSPVLKLYSNMALDSAPTSNVISVDSHIAAERHPLCKSCVAVCTQDGAMAIYVSSGSWPDFKMYLVCNISQEWRNHLAMESNSTTTVTTFVYAASATSSHQERPIRHSPYKEALYAHANPVLALRSNSDFANLYKPFVCFSPNAVNATFVLSNDPKQPPIAKTEARVFSGCLYATVWKHWLSLWWISNEPCVVSGQESHCDQWQPQGSASVSSNSVGASSSSQVDDGASTMKPKRTSVTVLPSVSTAPLLKAAPLTVLSFSRLVDTLSQASTLYTTPYRLTQVVVDAMRESTLGDSDTQHSAHQCTHQRHRSLIEVLLCVGSGQGEVFAIHMWLIMRYPTYAITPMVEQHKEMDVAVPCATLLDYTLSKPTIILRGTGKAISTMQIQNVESQSALFAPSSSHTTQRLLLVASGCTVRVVLGYKTSHDDSTHFDDNTSTVQTSFQQLLRAATPQNKKTTQHYPLCPFQFVVLQTLPLEVANPLPSLSTTLPHTAPVVSFSFVAPTSQAYVSEFISVDLYGHTVRWRISVFNDSPILMENSKCYHYPVQSVYHLNQGRYLQPTLVESSEDTAYLDEAKRQKDGVAKGSDWFLGLCASPSGVFIIRVDRSSHILTLTLAGCHASLDLVVVRQIADQLRFLKNAVDLCYIHLEHEAIMASRLGVEGDPLSLDRRRFIRCMQPSVLQWWDIQFAVRQFPLFSRFKWFEEEELNEEVTVQEPLPSFPYACDQQKTLPLIAGSIEAMDEKEYLDTTEKHISMFQNYIQDSGEVSEGFAQVHTLLGSLKGSLVEDLAICTDASVIEAFAEAALPHATEEPLSIIPTATWYESILTHFGFCIAFILNELATTTWKPLDGLADATKQQAQPQPEVVASYTMVTRETLPESSLTRIDSYSQRPICEQPEACSSPLCSEMSHMHEFGLMNEVRGLIQCFSHLRKSVKTHFESLCTPRSKSKSLGAVAIGFIHSAHGFLLKLLYALFQIPSFSHHRLAHTPPPFCALVEFYEHEKRLSTYSMADTQLHLQTPGLDKKRTVFTYYMNIYLQRSIWEAFFQHMEQCLHGSSSQLPMAINRSPQSGHSRLPNKIDTPPTLFAHSQPAVLNLYCLLYHLLSQSATQKCLCIRCPLCSAPDESHCFSNITAANFICPRYPSLHRFPICKYSFHCLFDIYSEDGILPPTLTEIACSNSWKTRSSRAISHTIEAAETYESIPSITKLVGSVYECLLCKQKCFKTLQWKSFECVYSYASCPLCMNTMQPL